MQRWQKASGGLLILFLGTLSATGCAKKSPTLPKHTITSAPVIIQTLEKRKKIIQDLKAFAHISLTTPEKKFSAKHALILLKPHYLRLETLSFFGYPMAYLFANGQQISFYNPGENRLFRGSSQVNNIFRLTGIALEIGKIVAILCGEIPSNFDKSHPELRFDPENTLYSLRLKPNEEIKLGALDLLPRQYKFTERAGEIEVSYQQYKKIHGLFFPFDIQIKFPHLATTIQIKYSEVEFNQAVPISRFELPRLEGVEVIDLDGKG